MVDAKCEVLEFGVKITKLGYSEEDGSWRYSAFVMDRMRKFVSRRYGKNCLMQPTYVIGENVDAQSDYDTYQAGKIAGYEVDENNRLRYKILWDEAGNLASQIRKPKE